MSVGEAAREQNGEHGGHVYVPRAFYLSDGLVNVRRRSLEQHLTVSKPFEGFVRDLRWVVVKAQDLDLAMKGPNPRAVAPNND